MPGTEHRSGHARRCAPPGAAYLALLGALLLPSSGAPAGEDAQQWLTRMARAARDLNYDATFVYRNGSTMESMRIIHRSRAEGERERLIALSGAAREVIRDSRNVTCILPDDSTVVVTQRRQHVASTRAVFDPEVAGSVGLSTHYRTGMRRGERVAGRATRLITVDPRDRFRYGYRISVDAQTHLLLKSQLVDRSGAVLEEVIYTSLSLPDAISDRLLEPGLTGKGYRRLTVRESAAAPSDEAAWRVGWLPEGFVLSDHARDAFSPERAPAQHFIFSDGLASVSVFVERLAGGVEPLDGVSTMGAVNAFGRVVDGHQVTVVGEVPEDTVSMVGRSVAPR